MVHAGKKNILLFVKSATRKQRRVVEGKAEETVVHKAAPLVFKLATSIHERIDGKQKGLLLWNSSESVGLSFQTPHNSGFNARRE